MLGMNVDHAAFRNLMNNMEVVKKYGTPDLSHSDIQLLRKVLKIDGSHRKIIEKRTVFLRKVLKLHLRNLSSRAVTKFIIDGWIMA